MMLWKLEKSWSRILGKMGKKDYNIVDLAAITSIWQKQRQIKLVSQDLLVR